MTPVLFEKDTEMWSKYRKIKNCAVSVFIFLYTQKRLTVWFIYMFEPLGCRGSRVRENLT